MIGPNTPIRTGSIAAVGLSSDSRRTRAGATMFALAGRIAGSLARELGLIEERRGRQQHHGDQDLYDVMGAARDLSAGLGGGPADEGRLARTLGDFVTESASLIGARPVSGSLERIEAAIARGEAQSPGLETVDSAVATIDRSTAEVVRDVQR